MCPIYRSVCFYASRLSRITTSLWYNLGYEKCLIRAENRPGEMTEMILQSRKWRLLIRAATLLVTSLVMLAFAGPASYALQDDTPRLITGPVELTNKEKPLANSYANATALPDTGKAFAVEEVGVTYYWVPLHGYNNKLFVRTKNVSYALPYNYVTCFTTDNESYYEG